LLSIRRHFTSKGRSRGLARITWESERIFHLRGRVSGTSDTGAGVYGQTIEGAVSGYATNFGTALYGYTVDGKAVDAISTARYAAAIYATNNATGGTGISATGTTTGVYGHGGTGIYGDGTTGVYGQTAAGQNAGAGVLGYGSSKSLGVGVKGQAERGGTGVWAYNPGGQAAWFDGATTVRGNFSVINGTKNFEMDDPRDPPRMRYAKG
jgi:hypothetical protein